jgi:hypothetical protein
MVQPAIPSNVLLTHSASVATATGRGSANSNSARWQNG